MERVQVTCKSTYWFVCKTCEREHCFYGEELHNKIWALYAVAALVRCADDEVVDSLERRLKESGAKIATAVLTTKQEILRQLLLKHDWQSGTQVFNKTYYKKTSYYPVWKVL